MFDKDQKQREREKQEKLARYRRVFSTDDGKLVLKDILEAGHVFRPSFVAGHADLTAFNEGERNMALMIMHSMQIDGRELQEIAEYDD